MPRAWSPCSQPGCPELTPPGQSRCPTHAYDRQRPTARARGYGRAHQTRFREGVLAREPYCRLCHARATVADHHPLSRRELVARGLDADDPSRGRGLCVRCHNRETSRREGGARNFAGGGG
jgi:5-methylcytosine-specific restriction protein A